MKKPQQTYDLPIPDDDYKMASVMERDKANFESRKIWFYVGADISNPSFAKVGITMGDLSGRSYGTNNPNYYIFCAFQCSVSTTKEQLKNVERGALAYLDGIYPNQRIPHMESQKLSECYGNIVFEDFFCCVHDYLYDNHLSYFLASDFENNVGVIEGHAIAWEFNPRIPEEVRRRFLGLILRY